MTMTLNDIALLVDGAVVGDDTISIEHISPINDIKANTLVLADSEVHFKTAENSDAAAILTDSRYVSSIKPVIHVANPFLAFITILNHVYPARIPPPEIHPTAAIADNVVIGCGVSIGAHVVIESGAVIEDDCQIRAHVFIGHDVHVGVGSILHPKVTIYDGCDIGRRVVIHAGTVIGSDGFGYKFINGQHVKVPHVGHVVIESDVEIGANTTIDRATIGATIIGQGTKIDNLVQIAHSVKLGQHNILCAFTGIAGSTVSGDRVIFAANVGVSDHVRIDDDVVLGPRCAVASKKHLRQGLVYLGSPARPKEKAIENELAPSRIPGMRKKIRALSEQVAELTRQMKKLTEEA